MADNTRNESITELVPKTLADYVFDNIETLKEALIGFPEPNVQLNMPSITISAQSPDFNPTGVPYPIKAVETADIENHKAPVEWIVGDYEFSLQVDIWAKNKEELDDMYDELFNVLNPKITPMGVSLVMEDYYKLICDYIYVGHTRDNSGASAQRDEWRISLNVLATCKAVRSRKEFIIEETELITEVNKDVLDTDA